MDIMNMLFRWGIGTWALDIITTIPNNAPGSQTFQIGKNLPTNIGFIYGCSTYADGTDPEGDTLISTTQAQNLYISFKDGPTEFIETYRLSDLLNEFAGSPVVRPDKFTPMNIAVFDLSKSLYYNPLLFNSGTIHLKLHYIQLSDWKDLQKEFKFKAPSSYGSVKQ